MYCGKCGNKLEEHVTYCSNCGTAVIQQSTPIQASTPIPPPVSAPVPASIPDPIPAPESVRSGSANKRLIIIAVVAVVVIFGAYKLFSGGGSQSHPGSAVEGFIEAANDQDIDEMMKYFLPNPDLTGRELQRAKIELERNVYDFEAKKYKILHVEEHGNQAVVEYMIGIERDGELVTRDGEFELVRIDGKWYIDGDIFDL